MQGEQVDTGRVRDDYDVENDLVITYARFMAYHGDWSHGGFRGRAWTYLIDRFERDERMDQLPVYDKYEGLETEPKTGLEIPSGIRFVHHPDDYARPWMHDEVNGLVVPSLWEFVKGVNAALDKAETTAHRERILRRKMGRNVGVAILSHLDDTARHFLGISPEDARD